MDTSRPTKETRARAEGAEKLNRVKNMLRRGEQLAGMGSWHWDVLTNTLQWSEELYGIYGLDPATPLTYETFLERVHPDDRDRVKTVVAEALKQRTPFRYEERIIRPDGAVRILSSQGDLETDALGQVLSFFGFCRDVTEERRIEQLVKDREELFRKIFHSNPVATIVTTLENDRVLDVNARFLELTGYSRVELLEEHSRGCGPYWDSPSQRDQVVERLSTAGPIREMNLRYHHREGHAVQVLASIELVKIGGSDCLLTLVWRT